MQAEVTKSYNSFSGVDIQATFAGQVIGTLQGVSYTVTREKAPVYTMGQANARAFSRGKRGIAGSLIFAVLNRSNLIEALGSKSLFWASMEDQSWLKRKGSAGKYQESAAEIQASSGASVVEAGNVSLQYAWYHDQIPPFNITLTAMTEYGVAARMQVIGVEILNAGSGISIDDITTDENMTFVARDIMPWRFLGAAPVNVTDGTVHSYNQGLITS